MLSAVDDGVGMVLDTLEKHALRENTLIFFIGDNGAPLKIHKRDTPDLSGWDGSLNGCSYNMMLRGECWAAILVDVSPEFLPAAYGESQSAYRQDGSGSLVLPTRTRFA